MPKALRRNIHHVSEDQEDQEDRGIKGERLGMGFAHENRTSADDEEIRWSS
ncbi:hypothetical protein [Lederbergia panacisoli]|uniref:hypothetical protein n=1 Tax=Lederbergia panacisoli TaxID=1255251 RepID=UPI00214BD64E|nr:hypothetical protein [Lederbergia panacisoli]MCR2823272.1 hypothetical protein [Lederbergia panacisoli]